MDQRRFVLFLTLSLGFMLLWSNFVLPRFAPPPAPEVPQQAEQPADQPVDQPDDQPQPIADGQAAADPSDTADAEAPADSDEDTVAVDETPESAATADAEDTPPEVAAVEPSSWTLGSLDPETGHLIEAEFSSLGASIRSVRLSHPKFGELTDRNQPLQLLGDTTADFQSLATRLTRIDPESDDEQAFRPVTHWKRVAADQESVTFETALPDGIVASKTYRLFQSSTPIEDWDSFPNGYRIDCELAFRNPTDEPVMLQYHMQGPVGLRLENAEHTRKYRDVKVGFFKENGSTKLTTMTSNEIYKDFRAAADALIAEGKVPEPDAVNRRLESWQKAFKYIAVDVQFFAAVLAPMDDRELNEQLSLPWPHEARPMLISGNATQPSWSDISFQFESQPIQVAPAGEVTHRYAFYAGPKRETLLGAEPFAAAAVLDHGSILGPISKAMLALLRFLHGLGLPYALCIVCMTLLVRGCLYPLSSKQARGAKKMKELQPKLAELKAKYGEDREKMARAQMELFRKNNYNPFAGCLPIFFQFPIFIGLYTALNVAVDLRLEPFLWSDNLAAPDRLFRMPFELPFLGSDFNLLPVVTCVLFIVQQKMFMPPPTDEQQELQQKMMSYMTIMFGFMFWHVPAGLCVYFIASSLWGLAERKLLDLKKDDDLVTEVSVDEPKADKKSAGKNRPGAGKKGGSNGADPNAKKGFFARLAEAAEEANRQAQSAKRQDTVRKGKKKKRT